MSTPDELIIFHIERTHETGDMKQLIAFIKIYKNFINKENIKIAMNLINELANEEFESMVI